MRTEQGAAVSSASDAPQAAKIDSVSFEKRKADAPSQIKALEKDLANTKKRYEKYLGIQESGEATTRQQTILFKVEERYNDLDNLVNDLKKLIDLSKRLRDSNRVKNI